MGVGSKTGGHEHYSVPVLRKAGAPRVEMFQRVRAQQRTFVVAMFEREM